MLRGRREGRFAWIVNRVVSIEKGVSSWLLRGALSAVLSSLLLGCATRYPLRDPTGERFPTVTGTSLAGAPTTFPDAVAGRPAVLLIAYEQQTQFDVDRWLLGFVQAQLDAAIYELPTIPGAIPGLFAGSIDEGMRGGIPKEDWAVVVTMYDDGDAIARFTGNDKRRGSARVVVLDERGHVRFFHDSGYSARLVQKVIALTKTSTGS